MKKLICLIVLSSVIFSTSCTKKPLCCVLAAPIEITAQKNGKAWQLPILKSTLTNNTISINTAGPYLLHTAKDSLSISLLYTGLGNYTPANPQITYTAFSNGIKTNYQLDPSFDNSITITSYGVLYHPATTNPDQTEIKATFNLRFIAPANASTVSLLNGKITAYLAN